MGRQRIDALNVYVPFVFSETIDPRSVVTVGDHFVSEHVFGSHAKSSARNGFEGHLSQVEIDSKSRTVKLTPRKDVRRSDGTTYSVADACDAIKSSLQGTRHSMLAPLAERVDCDGEAITIHFRKIPVNIRYLLNLADFFMFDVVKLPLRSGNLPPTTGPYQITSMAPSEVSLRRNQYFPKDEIANAVDAINIRAFPAGKTHELIQVMKPTSHHLAYLYGYALDSADYAVLQKNGYEVEFFPSDWLVYLGFSKTTTLAERITIGAAVDDMRSALEPAALHGQPAFSTTPIDRPFGIDEAGYKALAPRTVPPPARPLTLTTLEEWASLPLFDAAIRGLKTRLPHLTVKLIARNEFARVFEGDVYLSPVGQTPADPLTHLSFMVDAGRSIDSVVQKGELTEISGIEDAKAFDERILDIERRILKARAMIPLFHFPGVVVTSNLLEKDPKLSSNWGIQAWTYRIK